MTCIDGLSQEYGDKKMGEGSNKTDNSNTITDTSINPPPFFQAQPPSATHGQTLVLGYDRVSTSEQAYQQALVRHAARLSAAGATRIYADIASRTIDDRSGLMQLMADIRSGCVKKVLVVRIDRLTSSPGLFELITSELKKYRVILEFLDEDIDLHSVDGEFLAGLKVLLARREVRMGGLRVNSSREPDRQKNRANFCAPWGYKYNQGRYELDHTPYLCLLEERPLDNEVSPGRTKAELGRDVVELFFQGKTLSATLKLIHQKYGIQKFAKPTISNDFYVFEGSLEFKSLEWKRAGIFRWSRDGIGKYLKNPVLCGHTVYGAYKDKLRQSESKWDIRHNTHTNARLLTDAEKREIESMLATNQSLGGWGVAATLPLTGLLFCGECGRKLKCKGISESGRRYYQCKNYMERACTARHTIRMDKAESALAEVLIERAAAITQYASTPPEYVEPPELQQLRSQLAGLEALGHNPAFETAKNDLRSQIAALVERSKTKNVVDVELQQLLTDSFSDPEYWNWDKLTSDHKRQIYRDLVRRVVVRDGQVVSVELKV